MQTSIPRRGNLYLPVCRVHMRYLQTSTKFVQMDMKTDIITKSIHVKTDGYKMNPCIRDFLNPKWIQNSINSHHGATRCMDQVSYFLKYCYHITTKCMEHPPLHLRYRMIFTCTLKSYIQKLPKSVLYDMRSPFLSWKLGGSPE